MPLICVGNPGEPCRGKHGQHRVQTENGTCFKCDGCITTFTDGYGCKKCKNYKCINCAVGDITDENKMPPNGLNLKVYFKSNESDDFDIPSDIEEAKFFSRGFKSLFANLSSLTSRGSKKMNKEILRSVLGHKSPTQTAEEVDSDTDLLWDKTNDREENIELKDFAKAVHNLVQQSDCDGKLLELFKRIDSWGLVPLAWVRLEDIFPAAVSKSGEEVGLLEWHKKATNYFEKQLSLFMALCKGQNTNAIKELGKVYTTEVLASIGLNSDLAASVRAAAFKLLNEIHLQQPCAPLCSAPALPEKLWLSSAKHATKSNHSWALWGSRATVTPAR